MCIYNCLVIQNVSTKVKWQKEHSIKLAKGTTGTLNKYTHSTAQLVNTTLVNRFEDKR